nr:transcription factor [Quercus suber]
MNPLLYYRIREEDVLASIYQCEFCWESIIQRRLLSPEWNKCTWVEFSFISDTLDVSALRCGVELVFQHNLEEFTLAQCITSYNGPYTSNEILPFEGESLPPVEVIVYILSRLIPGSRKQPLPVIIEIATDYIAAHEMQVRAMTTLANLLCGSSSSSASCSSAPPPS